MSDNYLIHYGIKGQHWGERNYQYDDGSLTPEGKLRYYGKNYAKGIRKVNDATKRIQANNRSAFTKNRRDIRNSDMTLSERRSAIRGEKHAMKAANKEAYNKAVVRSNKILKKTSYADIWVDSLKQSSYGIGSVLVGKILKASGNDALKTIGFTAEQLGNEWIIANAIVGAANSYAKYENEN